MLPPRLARDLVENTYYQIDGALYPRVSAILSEWAQPWLADWQRRVGWAEADATLAAACELGTTVHALCEQLARGASMLRVTSDQALLPFVWSFHAWLTQEVEEVLAVEHLLVSREWGYAGTMDLLVRMRDGRVMLSDIKTSRRLHESYRAQIAAYRQALLETEGIAVDGRQIIHLPSSRPGNLRIVEYAPDTAQEDWITYRALLWLYKQRAKHARPSKAVAATR